MICPERASVDANTTDAEAEPGADMPVITSALVAVGMTAAHAVKYPHHAPTAAATRQPGEQGATAAAGFAGRTLLHVRVLEKHALVLGEPLPGDVALVMVADQDVPVGHGLLVAFRLHGTAVDDARPFGPAPEGIGTGVDRVVQHLHHAVVDGAPGDAPDRRTRSATGRLSAASRAQRKTGARCRARETSRTPARMTSLTRSSGSSSMRPSSLQQKPGGSVKRSAAAGLRVPCGEATLPEETKLVLDIVPFRPSSSRSFIRRGS